MRHYHTPGQLSAPLVVANAHQAAREDKTPCELVPPQCTGNTDLWLREYRRGWAAKKGGAA